jgi:hypothetical protein
MPLLERVQARYRGMYWPRWTFVGLARASDEAAFRVSRVIGHARSTIVDTSYAHTVDSSLAEVSESVLERLGLARAHRAAHPQTCATGIPARKPGVNALHRWQPTQRSSHRQLSGCRDCSFAITAVRGVL